MRLPRFCVRTLLITIAVFAVVLGGGLEYLRLKRLSERYSYSAWGYAGNVRMRVQDLSRLKPKLQKLKESPDADRVQLELLYSNYYWLQAQIAENANLVQIYEHAASHPWEAPPRFAEAVDGVENSPTVRWILTNPPAPPASWLRTRSSPTPSAPLAPQSPTPPEAPRLPSAPGMTPSEPRT
jgi:hypothetical protein